MSKTIKLVAAGLLPLLTACASGAVMEEATSTVAPATAAQPAATGAPPAIPAAATIPVTTRSAEARRLFEEGRLLAHNIRTEEARERIDQAIAADPTFALAYASRAALSPPAERQRFLDQARAHASSASEGERRMIEQYVASHEGDQDRRVRILEDLAQQYSADRFVLGDLAVQYYGRGEYGRAVQTLERVIAVSPDYGPAYNMLGYSHKAQGDFAAAERAFQSYIRTSPDEPNPHDSLGELYLTMGRFDEARTHFQRALEISPRFFHSRQNIGNAYLLAGQFDASRTAYRNAMQQAESDTDRIDMQLRIAESYVHHGDHARAKQALAEARTMARDADHTLAQFWVLSEEIDLHADLGELDRAESLVNEMAALAASSDLLPVQREFWGTEGTLLYRTDIAARRGNVAEASRLADEFATRVRERGGPMALHGVPRVYGLVAFARRDYAEAIRHLEEDSDNPYSLYHIGLAYEAMNQADRARPYFEKVATLNNVTNHRMPYALVRSKAQAKLR